jgi:hypothetical protein
LFERKAGEAGVEHEERERGSLPHADQSPPVLSRAVLQLNSCQQLLVSFHGRSFSCVFRVSSEKNAVHGFTKNHKTA